MDELAVGFPLGAAGLPIATVLVAIGAQAFFVTAGGIIISAVGIWLIVESLGR